jgi:hypothetical protein
VDGTPWGALALLAVALVVDAWIYVDARQRRDAGDDVVASVGPVTLSTPEQWLVASLLLWVFVVPLYLVARRA